MAWVRRDSAEQADQTARSLAGALQRLEIEARRLAAQIGRELEGSAPPSRLRLALDRSEDLKGDSARLLEESGRLINEARSEMERRRGELGRSLRASRERRHRADKRSKD